MKVPPVLKKLVRKAKAKLSANSRKLLAVAAAVALVVGAVYMRPAKAVDALVAKGPEVELTITLDKCTNAGILKQAKVLKVGPMFHGYATVKGKPMKVCWADNDPEAVFIIDETGASGYVAKQLFRPKDAI